jgi:hypothetical protein
MKRRIVKDQLAGRPVSLRVDLDGRGHAGQETDAIRYLIDRMRAGTRKAVPRFQWEYRTSLLAIRTAAFDPLRKWSALGRAP